MIIPSVAGDGGGGDGCQGLVEGAATSIPNLDALTSDLATSSTSSFKTIDNNLSDSSTCSSELLNMSINSKQMDMKDDCADLNQILSETLELTKLLAIKGAQMDAATAAAAGQNGVVVALAEAEVDDDDAEIEAPQPLPPVVAAEEVEFVDKDTTSNNTVSESPVPDESVTPPVDEQPDEADESRLTSSCGKIDAQKIINEMNKRNSACGAAHTKTPTVVLNPEERISSEAKEYWATIDLYNNSKLAFNKRCKSVKQKREKLNAEWEQRNKQRISSGGGVDSTAEPLDQESAQPKLPEICSCVKCSIVYHEALIRGITDVNAIICNKCNNKLIYCRCCSSATSLSATSLPAAAVTVSNGSSSHLDAASSSSGNSRSCPSSDASSISTSSSNISSKSSSSKSIECSQLDDKIFSIKNELVSLSETSLDVFQLLLQLSDTMLELNSQINSAASFGGSATNQHMLAFTNFLESSGLSSTAHFPPMLDSNSTTNLSLVNEEDGYPLVNSDEPGHYYAGEQMNPAAGSASMASKIRSVVESCASTTNRPLDESSFAHKMSQPLKITNPNYYRAGAGADPGPMSPRTANSITSIINSLNKKAETAARCETPPSVSGPLLTPVSAKYRRMSATPGDEQLDKSSSFRKSSTGAAAAGKQYQQQQQQQSPLPSPCSSCSSTKLIENLYDKTSVTQFVDNLLNQHAHGHADCCLSATTSEDYSIEEDCNSLASGGGGGGGKSQQGVNRSLRISTTTAVTNQILAKQQSSSLIASKLNEYNMMGGSFRKGVSPATSPSVAANPVAAACAKSCVGTTMKSSSSSTSSSSGCGGSSSLCFSSNIDLTSLPSSSSSSTNIIEENGAKAVSATTVNRRSLSSVKSSEASNISDTIQSYRHSTVSTTVSSSSSSQKLSPSSEPTTQASSSSSSCSTTSAFEMVNQLLDSASSFDDEGTKSNTLPKDKSPSRSSSSQPQSQRVAVNQVLYKPVAAVTSAASHRSNSVNYKNNQVVVASGSITNQQLANVVAHDASLQAHRKPSFKFESSILNRVQNMNLSKMKMAAPVEPALPSSSSSSSESEVVVVQPIIKQSHHQQVPTESDATRNVKRKHSINRQPIIAMPTSSSLLKVQHDLTNKHLSSLRVAPEAKAGSHQVSIDSGIYVPPESDESTNLPSISLVH